MSHRLNIRANVGGGRVVAQIAWTGDGPAQGLLGKAQQVSVATAESLGASQARSLDRAVKNRLEGKGWRVEGPITHHVGLRLAKGEGDHG